jgi:hypothetical protein
MTDIKTKITDLLEKQKKAIEAQRAESERIAKERQDTAINEKGQSAPFQSQPPNK